MAHQLKPSKTIHILLWVAQLVLALTFGWAALMKLFQPTATLAAMWPWAGQIPEAWVRVTGLIDLLGALGLVLPSFLRIQPKLTPVAAISIVVLMVCASIFHIARGEVAQIGANVVFAGIAAFIAWGRMNKAPIEPK
ncbi:DoxX family protein [Spirosoma agri]|uniref:DoxX family protein n=1 Tax=Spirosoma agri TaxID=1987381 RepID=A0A6M0IJR7_9BACT|nr:DoxX family protein [Spirosoma agri]NEU68052.1 DoxX family protein [Spirosoma agri]